MLRGPLHNKGADGRCEECGEPFPCSTGLAIYEAVKLELEASTAAAATVVERCPWCGVVVNGRELPDAHGHRHCRHCAGCIAANPKAYGTDAYEAWAVAHGNV